MIQDKDGDTIELKIQNEHNVVIQVKEGHIFASVILNKKQLEQFIAQAVFEFKQLKS